MLLKGVVLSACTLSFWPYLRAAGAKGLSSGDYSHVFVIPLIALGVYLNSPRAAPQPPRPALGGALAACGILLRAAGEYWCLPLLAEAAFPFLLIGFVDLLFGRAEARRVTFPALFLLFSFGFVTDILLKLFVDYLVLASTGAAYDAAVTFVPQLGPYVLMGNTITVPPRIRFDVVEACSGVRGILALFVIGSVVGYAKKLTWRPALRFTLLIAVVTVATNLLRIAATIVSSLALHGRVSHDFLHAFWNYALFGTLILLTPVFVNWAQRMRIRCSLIGVLAAVTIVIHVAQWHVRASEGNARLMVRQLPPYAQPQATLVVDQHGIPRAFLPYVSPELDGRRRWRWLVTSAFVHSSISHLAVNMFLLLLLAHALREDLRWPWTAAILLAGQVVGAGVGWLTWSPPAPETKAVFTGASCAVSGLFGAYLVAHLLAHRKWIQAPTFLLVYLAGLWPTAGRLGPAYQFSFTSHLAGLAAGTAIAALRMAAAKRPKKNQENWLTVDNTGNTIPE